MADRDTHSEQDLLSIGEAARLMGVSVGTLRRYDADGKISSVRTLGGQRRFRREDVDRIAAGETAVAS